MRSPKVLGIVIFTAAAWLAAAAPARAQVRITIHDNRVSLVAKDATLGQILAEWAKVGETMLVNSDRIPGGPLTLQLTDVPEAEALDILLRAVSGYIAVPRSPPVAGLSRFDRIIVMPTVGAPVPDAMTTATPRRMIWSVGIATPSPSRSRYQCRSSARITPRMMRSIGVAAPSPSRSRCQCRSSARSTRG